MKRTILFAAACAAGLAWGKTWWVDAQATGEMDGSEAAPFATIQAAIDAAEAGDTVKVRPGVYDTGDNKLNDNDSERNLSRVVVDKKLRIESTDGAARTHIVGASDPSKAFGLGEAAVRCVTIATDAAGSVLKGFTIRDGRSRAGEWSKATHGGGVVFLGGVSNNQYNAYVVDCVVSNCVATRGGAVFNITAIRSLFMHNYTSGGGGSAARQCNLYSSVFSCNGYSKATESHCAAAIDIHSCANCTFYDNFPGSVHNDANFAPQIDNCVLAREPNDVSVALSSIVNKSATLRNCVYTSVQTGENGELLKLVNCRQTANLGVDLLLSPYEHDWRPVRGEACDGTGDPARASPDWVPEEFRGTDFHGQPLVVNGRAPVGAVAESAVPAGGSFFFAPGIFVNRWATAEGLDAAVNYTGRYPFIRRTVWPSQVVLDTSRSSTPVFRLQRSHGCGYVYPDMEGRMCLTLPPAGYDLTNTMRTCQAQIYVDAEKGSDDFDGSASEPEGGESAVGPKRTIQAAVDASPNWALVRVAPGVYDEGGGTTLLSWATRVAIKGKNLILRGAGADVTTIKGQRDPDSAANENGCGPKAMRCITIDRSGDCNSAVMGFTLADGCMNSGGDNTAAYQGGAFHCNGKNFNNWLLQCVVTNSAGSRGGAAYGGSFHRTLFVDNETSSKAQSIARCAYFASCLFLHNAHRSAASQVMASDYAVALNCTFADNKPAAVIAEAKQVSVLNCVISGSATSSAGGYVRGSYQGSYANGLLGFTYEPRLFADAEAGDYRPLVGPLVGGGEPGAPDRMLNESFDTDLLYTLLTGFDIDGNPMCFVEGRPTAGAFQSPVPSIRVSAVKAGDAVSETGLRPLVAGETVTVVAAGDRADGRQYLGIQVDGALAVQAPATEWTYTYDGTPRDRTVDVRILYNTDWYADPVSGNDANDGWTPATARRTLAKAVEHAIAGDTVHLAPGTYDAGTMPDGASNGMNVRVNVPAGVTLEGAGSETTVIKGVRNGKVYAGTNVRCVKLNNDSVLRGVTVSSGSVTQDAASNNGYAGGVLGTSYDRCLVENCTVTNCWGSRGAAGVFVTFRNCRIVGNDANNGAAGRQCGYVNCFIDANAGTQVILMHYGLLNCTYGARNSTGIQNGLSTPRRIANTVFLWKGTYGSANPVNEGLTNVVFVSGAAINKGVSYSEDNVVFKDLDEIALDTDGCPLIGSCLIDAGSADAPIRAEIGPTDLAGGQRVYNGAPDIGCFEYDWRPRYASDLGLKRLTVTRADPEVVEDDGRVFLPSGELVVDWPDFGSMTRRLTADVTGTGRLLLYVGDDAEPAHVWTAGDASEWKWTAAPAGATRFVYEPGEADEGGAYLHAFAVTGGTVLLFR